MSDGEEVSYPRYMQDNPTGLVVTGPSNAKPV